MIKSDYSASSSIRRIKVKGILNSDSYLLTTFGLKTVIFTDFYTLFIFFESAKQAPNLNPC